MPSLKTGRSRPLGMEPNRQSAPASRTAVVLYLICRGAQREHPHMINVPYAAHQPGPTLRDVKARLVAVRGKRMPDSFSWSYKRSYKETFIWCDLFDDDFILPLPGSDDYILKATELFDAAAQDGEGLPCENEELAPVRHSSPSKATSRVSSKPEHHHVENDVSNAIKKSLLLINIPAPAAEITTESSMDLNKQIMNNLSHSKRAPEVCSLERSDVSSSGTFPSFEDVATKHSSFKSSSTAARSVGRVNSSSQTGAAATPKFAANLEKHCKAASQTAHRELKDVTAACNLEVGTTKDKRTSISPSLMRTPRSEGSARRKTWEEMDKSTLYAQFLHKSIGSEDERPDSALEKYSGSNRDQDPFLFGVLKRATRLGSSFRPRLCRGVDVVDSTRTKTKLHFRNKTKEDVGAMASSFFEEPSVEDNADSPIRPETKSLSSYASPEKPMKEFTTLTEFFDSRERANSNSSPPVDKLINELHSVEETAPRPTQVGLAQEDSSAAMAADSPPNVESLPRRPFGNEALDASYRKTMEVLAKLPTSRGACRVHTMPQSEDYHRSTRSESKGNKQEAKLDSRPSFKESTGFNSRQGDPKPSCEHDEVLHRSCAIRGMDDPVVVKTQEGTPKDGMAPKQRRPAIKKATMASFEASTVSCRAKATVKSLDEKITLKGPKNARKESTTKPQVNMEDSTKPQLPESLMFDSRSLHNGNKQGLKMASQVATTKIEAFVAEAGPKMSSKEGAKRGPFEPPVRSRDFKSREDRPLIPGVTTMDWERSFQEACMHSGPPTNMVLQECSQCGRTFKPESLQVHMRGCRGVSKPRSSSVTQRSRRESI